jgi:hypothetical protein
MRTWYASPASETVVRIQIVCTVGLCTCYGIGCVSMCLEGVNQFCIVRVCHPSSSHLTHRRQATSPSRPFTVLYCTAGRSDENQIARAYQVQYQVLTVLVRMLILNEIQ